MKISYKNIPTYDYDTKEWSTTSFDDQLSFGQFLLKHCFKEPGEYKFDERVFKWKEQGDTWTREGSYTPYAEGTAEYYDYWDKEELKSRLGVIWKSKDIIWYTTRDYYFLLNYCPIVNKEKGYTETFADIRDAQYHMMLYEKLAEIFHQHASILKRRQMLFSFCHVAKTVNYLFFENRKRLKWFASDEAFIDDVNGSWSILNQYKSHINKYTDWYRSFAPDGNGEIQQRQQVKINGKWEWEGNDSSVVARTLKKDPKLGVGGPTFWAWFEEGGIAPKADVTLQYMEPAMISGLIRVGSFCIGGSVGDLTECKPLENFIKYPSKYGFFKVPTRWWDESGTVKECGLFIPAQYGMPEATDIYGNSEVDKALMLLHKAEFEGFKAGEYGKIADEDPWINLPPQDYVLKKSQNPKNIKEAFAWRTVSFFNVQRIERRQKAIEILKERDLLEEEKGLLEEINGEIKLKKLSSFYEHNRPTEMIYPIDATIIDKRGCVTIYEYPSDHNDGTLYYAGVDSVEVGKTTTSNSIFSVDIYKRGHKQITIKDDGTQEVEHVRGKIVATYRGRFDNPDDHNEQGLLLIRLYKALAGCERNKPNFINYARRKGYASLIAKRSQFPLDKDLDITGGRQDEYGIWSDSAGKLLKIFKDTTYEYIDAEIDTVHKKTTDNSIGEVVKTIRGYDLIDDYWLLEELKLYNEDGNFDRFISFALAVLMGTVRELDYEKTTIVYSTSKEEKRKEQPKPRNLLKPASKLRKNLLKH